MSRITLPWAFTAFVVAMGIMFVIDSALSQGSSPIWLASLNETNAKRLAACNVTLGDAEQRTVELESDLERLAIDYLELKDLCTTQICIESDFAPIESIVGGD